MFKRLALSLLFLFALTWQASAAGCTGTGNCYWVGGTGNASNTAKWATASGGGTTGGLPNATDIANIDANSGGGTYTIDGNPTWGGLLAVNINKTDAISYSGNLAITANGPLTLAGLSATNRLFLKSSVLGTQRTITVSGTTTPSLTSVDAQDVKGAGNTPWTGTSLGDALGNTGITFDVSAAQTYSGSGGADNWSTAARWTSRVPLPQDDVTLPSTAASSVLTADMPRMGRNITATNYDRTLSFASTPNTLFGNVALGASGTFSGTQALTLAGRGAQTITSAGKTWPQTGGITIAAFGGSYTLQDAFSITGTNTTLSLTAGTLDSASFTLLAGRFSNSGTTTIKGTATSIWEFQSPTSFWATTSSLTTANFQATIKLSGNIGATLNSFVGSGLTYGTLWWSSTTSTGTLIITGANTFASLQSDNTTARTWQFPNGVVQTINPNGFQIKGKPGVLISLTSDSAGLPATLSMRAGKVNANYLSIKDSTVTGGAQWYAGQNSTNVSGNTGWLFRNAPNIIWLLKKKFGANDNWPQNRMAV